MIAETFNDLQEAIIALDVIQKYGNGTGASTYYFFVILFFTNIRSIIGAFKELIDDSYNSIGKKGPIFHSLYDCTICVISTGTSMFEIYLFQSYIPKKN